MKYFIGIDWGERKIGVAFGDDETCQSFSCKVLENDKNIFDKLNKIAIKYEANDFVIGIQCDKVYNDNSKKIKKFAKNLTIQTGKEVIFAEEMFSTREAQNNLKSANKKNLSEKDDVESARIILQNFLDTYGKIDLTSDG